MGIRFWIALMAALALLAPNAFAGDGIDEDDAFDRSGFYLGAGGSYQYNTFQSQIEDEIQDALADDLPPGSSLSIEFDESGGVNALIGYRAASFFAIELEYEWIDRYDIDYSTEGLAAISGDLYSIEGHTFTLNTKWIVPTWRIQPYLLLGGGLAISDVERGSIFDDPLLGPILEAAGIDIESGTHISAAARAGVGIDFYLTRSLLLNAEASLVATTLSTPDLDDVDDLNYLSFSAKLVYRF